MSSEQAGMPSSGQTRPRRRPSASGDAGAAAATPAAAVAADANADAAPPSSRSHSHHHHHHHYHHHHAPPSILDDLGEDLTGVATPVAVCMALTVALCRALNPDGASDAAAVRFASLAYEEKAGDTAAEKLGGGLLNALIFVAIMAGMTFGLFVLFKLKCYRVIAAYMGFSLFNIFFLLTGAVLVALCRTLWIPLDAVSLVLFLANLAAVGTAAIFFLPAPLALRQALLVWVGVVMAFVFSLVPEWTTWCLLAAMALYDLVAVLMPGGPLKILVELAVERQVDLPALVYESRPSGGRAYARGAWMRRGGGRGGGGEQEQEAEEGARGDEEQQQQQQQPEQAGRRPRWWRPPAAGGGDGSPSARVALLASGSEVGLAESPSARRRQQQQQQVGDGGGSGGGRPVAEGVEEDADLRRPLSAGGGGGGGASSSSGGGAAGTSAAAAAVIPAAPAATVAPEARQGGASGSGESGGESDDESDDDPSRPAGGMLLGMGDFIFYSALVGRAATYDLSTVFASFIAVLAGLVVTLLALGLAGRALPALPVSIALGALYCFGARWALGPVAVPLTVNGVYY